MGTFSKLFNWAKRRRAERPSAKQESRTLSAKEVRARQTPEARAADVQRRQAAAGRPEVFQPKPERPAAPSTKPVPLRRKEPADLTAEEWREIREKIERDRLSGNIPVGELVDDREVDPWSAAGSTGASIIDPSEIGESLDAGDMADFMAGKLTIMADSSNVEAIKYDPKALVLTVTFKAKEKWPRSQYSYWPIHEDVALNAFTASSKGSFTWSYLRIRGTKYGHQCSYRRIF